LTSIYKFQWMHPHVFIYFFIKSVKTQQDASIETNISYYY
jgi:hypothetical protein